MKKYGFCFAFVLLSNYMFVYGQEAGNIQYCLQKSLSVSLTASASQTITKIQNPYDNYINHSQVNNEDLIISNLRPRIFVRADEARLGRGLTVSALRSRLKDPAYGDWIDYNREVNGWESLPAIAMQYLLKGEKKNALAVGEYLANTPFPYKEHTSTAAAIYNSAIAFDWVRDALPDEMANKIVAKLVEGAEHLKEGVITPSINHNYTIVSLHGVAMVAIAIYGEGKENSQKALEYMKMVKSLLLSDHMLLETFKEKQGTWGEGNHYSPFVVFYPFLMTLRGLTTATNTDYFGIIRDKYENFIEPMSKFVIANFRPDFTLERIGDVTGRVVPHRSFMRPLLELLASEVNDVLLQGQVRSFSREMSAYYGVDLVPDVYRWMMLVTCDSKLPDKPSYKTLPLVMRFGENSYEQIMFRNNWEEGGTLITYISGDHYTDHQHFDKGHFLIYKKGGLIVDGGGYSDMYDDSWSNYSTRTLAHNNVLVYDPKEVPYKVTNGTEIYPDGGQRVIRGAQSQGNWQEYLNDNKFQGLNTADVLAFDFDRQSNRYNYVKSNLSKAYGEKVVWMDRQILYLPLADYLVVKDRVISSKPLNKYWLLHFEERPFVDAKLPAAGITDYKNDSIVYSQRTGELKLEGKTVQYAGRLFVKCLLPKKRAIAIIGGPGYEYFNRFANKNFPPKKTFNPNRESGNWRMEVSSAQPAVGTVFLHAFEITDTNKNVMVPTKYIKSVDGKMEGALFLSREHPYLVFFSSSMDERGHSFQKTHLPVTYKLQASAPTSHILVELEPDKKVKININNRSIGTFQTTKAGVLSFEDKGLGVRNVQIIAQ